MTTPDRTATRPTAPGARITGAAPGAPFADPRRIMGDSSAPFRHSDETAATDRAAHDYVTRVTKGAPAPVIPTRPVSADTGRMRGHYRAAERGAMPDVTAADPGRRASRPGNLAGRLDTSPAGGVSRAHTHAPALAPAPAPAHTRPRAHTPARAYARAQALTRLHTRPPAPVRAGAGAGFKSAFFGKTGASSRKFSKKLEVDAMTRDEMLDRFLARVEGDQPPAGQPWHWTGSLRRGVPQIPTGQGSKSTARRVAWVLFHGPIPEDMMVGSVLDDPLDVNPANLRLFTRSERWREVGRRPPAAPAGSGNPTAKLTEDQVREIRARYAGGAETMRGLGEEFGVAGATIYLIIHRKMWAHVE